MARSNERRLPFLLAAMIAVPAMVVRSEAARPPVRLEWAYRCDGSVQSGPVVQAGVVYAASMDGIVHAVDARAGTRLWQRQLGGMILAAPVVDSKRGQLLVGCDDGHVSALALADGAVRWKHRMPGDWSVLDGPQVKGTPLLDRDVVFATNLRGHVAALRATDGQPIWLVDGFGLIGGSAALAVDRLIFTSTERGIVCLETAGGKLAWEQRIGRSFSTPSVADGVAYVGVAVGPGWASRGHVVAIDVKTGRELWRFSLPGDGHFAGQVVGAPIITPTQVIVADIEGRLVGLERASGRVAWRRAEPTESCWAAGTSAGGHAWWASTHGRLLAVDLAKPTAEPWRLDLLAPLWTRPVVAGEQLFVGTDDGYVLCLSSDNVKALPRPPVQTKLRFKHPAPKRGELLHEFLGTASGFQSTPFGGPPRESDLRGQQHHFTFRLKVDRGGKGPDGKPVEPGRELQVVSRPLTNYFDWNCSPTFTGQTVDWSKLPRLRVVGSFESPVLNPYADGNTMPRPLCAYLIQPEPKPGTLVPPAHWPAWYVNNWVHFLCDIYEVGHDHYFANTGHINWGWDFVEERTMGQFLPRDVWANVRSRFYLWRAVNGLRQVRDPRTGILRAVPTTLTIYLSGAHHADPYHSERDLRAKPPQVTIHADRLSGKAPLAVTFRANVSDKHNPVQWVQWTFDAKREPTVNALDRETTHTFDKPGTYSVSATAVTHSGSVGHAHVMVQVER